MASGVLLITVMAVSAALTAGQHHAYVAHQRIAGTLAAEELMGRIAAKDYDDLRNANVREEPGTLEDGNGQAFPKGFAGIGRELWITSSLEEVDDVDVNVRGYRVRVRTFDENNTTLADIASFIPEPAGTTNANDGRPSSGSGGLGNDEDD